MPKAWFHPLAEKELVEAAQYYDGESPGLGARFLDAAERCVAGIMERPKAGRTESGDIRRRLVPSFPYAILYREVPNGVRLLAVNEPETSARLLGRQGVKPRYNNRMQLTVRCAARR